MRKALSILLLFLCITFGAKAQELQCDVRVNSAQVSGSDRTIFQNMQTALYEFVNNTKFTDINFRQNEKIECSILIDVKTRESDTNVTRNYVQDHLDMGIHTLMEIRNNCRSVKHLRFDED